MVSAQGSMCLIIFDQAYWRAGHRLAIFTVHVGSLMGLGYHGGPPPPPPQVPVFLSLFKHEG